jgi:hypothetical protein
MVTVDNNQSAEVEGNGCGRHSGTEVIIKTREEVFVACRIISFGEFRPSECTVTDRKPR